MQSQELRFDPAATVLLVDDHRDIRTLTEIFLRHTGFDVEAVDTGDAAIEFLQKTDVDVVITDLHLQGNCNGIALLTYHNRACPEGCRILFTADFSDKLRVVCQQIDALYVPKPIPLPDLLVKIKNCLSAQNLLLTNRANALGSLSLEKNNGHRVEESSPNKALFTNLQEASWRSYFARKADR